MFTALGLFVVSGCDFPPRPPIGRALPESREMDGLAMEETGDGTDFSPSRVEPWENWWLYVRDDSPVGYHHVVVRPDPQTDRGATVLVEDRLLVRQGAAVLVQHLRQQLAESPLGVLNSLESEFRVGPTSTTANAEVVGGTLRWQFRRGLQSTAERMPWDSTVRAPIEVERSLRRRPMAPGQTRSFAMLQPIGSRIVNVQLRCVGKAVVPMLDGQSVELLEIERLDTVDDQVVGEAVLWTDEAGDLRRMLVPSLGITSYRCEAAEIPSRWSPFAPEQIGAAIDVEGRLEDPSRTKLTLFQVTSGAGTPPRNSTAESQGAGIMPAPGQYVKELGDGRSNVLIRMTDKPQKVKGFRGFSSEVTEKDLNPSKTVDHRSVAVQEISRRATVSAGWSERDAALETAKLVTQLTTLEEQGRGWVSASEVAARASGDSFGRAALLTALLRSQKIPARVAVGLRFDSSSDSETPVMRLEAWTAAFYDGDWHPLDVLSGKPAHADRITLRLLDLADGENLHQHLIEVLQQMGRLRVAIVNSRVAEPS